MTAGQSSIAEIGVLHTFRNVYDESAVFTVEYIPAGGLVQAFQPLCVIANNGGADKANYPANFIEKLYLLKWQKDTAEECARDDIKLMFGFAAFCSGIAGLKNVLDNDLQK